MENKIDGKTIRLSLTTLLEMEMQSNLDKFKYEHPELLKLNTKSPAVGKIMLMSTCEELEPTVNFAYNKWLDKK